MPRVICRYNYLPNQYLVTVALCWSGSWRGSAGAYFSNHWARGQEYTLDRSQAVTTNIVKLTWSQNTISFLMPSDPILQIKAQNKKLFWLTWQKTQSTSKISFHYNLWFSGESSSSDQFTPLPHWYQDCWISHTQHTPPTIWAGRTQCGAFLFIANLSFTPARRLASMWCVMLLLLCTVTSHVSLFLSASEKSVSVSTGWKNSLQWLSV